MSSWLGVKCSCHVCWLFVLPLGWGSCACMACVCFEVAARGVILMRRVRCRILFYLYGVGP